MADAIPFWLPENQIVFTTNDGVGLRKFDQYWYVHSALKLRRITICSGQDFPKGTRQFATKESAEKYIQSNKPV